MKRLIGYHGTSMENANSILTQQHFLLSNGKAEWLGHGIYFFLESKDAFSRAFDDKKFKHPVVLRVEIEVEEHDILRLDLEENRWLLKELGVILDSSGAIIPDKDNLVKQCEIMNYIWDNFCPKVILGYFRIKDSVVHEYLYGSGRPEFCIIDEKLITKIDIMEVEK